MLKFCLLFHSTENHPIETLNLLPGSHICQGERRVNFFCGFCAIYALPLVVFVRLYRFSRSVASAIVWWRQETAPPAKVGKMGSIERWRSHLHHTRTGSALFPRNPECESQEKHAALRSEGSSSSSSSTRAMLEQKRKVLRFALYEGIFIQFHLLEEKTDSNENIIGRVDLVAIQIIQSNQTWNVSATQTNTINPLL